MDIHHKTALISYHAAVSIALDRLRQYFTMFADEGLSEDERNKVNAVIYTQDGINTDLINFIKST